MATAALAFSPEQKSLASQGDNATPQLSDDATGDAPRPSDPAKAQQEKNARIDAALLEIRQTFKRRYQPKRMRFISEAMRALEAFRGNTYALLNDQSAAMDTINQLINGYLGAGDDPQLYAHNDNVYQAFGMIFIAALMVDLGKVRWQPADGDDEADIEISRKGSTIQAYNERKNDIRSLQQLALLYLWLFGSYFCYVRYIIDEGRAGSSTRDKIAMRPQKLHPDGYMCPKCGALVPEDRSMMFQSTPTCPKCGQELSQANYFEGPEVEMPVVVGEEEVANGMTAFDILSGLMIDVNPDCMLINPLEGTEILDYSMETSVGKVRRAYPQRYADIQPTRGMDSNSDGDMAATARAGQTTPGKNQQPLISEGVGTYTRCWYTLDAFAELQDEEVYKELIAEYPKGCKAVIWGDSLILDKKPERLLDRWTWCGTVKGVGSYPPAAGASALDIQERITGAVNKIDAYMDRVAYGTMIYDADYIDGDALANKVLTPGNLTGVSRTDEESGERVPLPELFHQMTFQMADEIYKYPDALTVRGQFLVGIMPQIFGGSDKNIQTAEGQEQALNTALGRIKQYLDQMRGENARRARLSVRCSIDNADEEIKIVEQNETGDGWQVIRMLKQEIDGDFFTYPEDEEGFPSTFTQIQDRMLKLVELAKENPTLMQILNDPKVSRAVGRYVLPPGVTMPGDAEAGKVTTILRMLSQDKRGPRTVPNPGNPQGPPVVVPTILPDFSVDTPAVCVTYAKDWLLRNWMQEKTNPMGYANVMAYLKIAGQQAQMQQAQQQLIAQQEAEKQKQLPAGAQNG